MNRVTNEEIIESYKATGSVWKAAKQLGICGQSVWERLKRLGYTLSTQKWDKGEIYELTELAGQSTIGEISRRIGRPYAAVACKISELGLGRRYGNKLKRKIKRGSGLTKQSVRNIAQRLEFFRGPVRQFAIQNGMELEVLVQALERYEPKYWAEYRKKHSDLEEKNCPYCLTPFIPMTSKQVTCSRKCSSDMRVDRKYFGGKRRSTIGLLQGICQLDELKRKRLSSHHIFGKENDPENDFLIALCSGCHSLVGQVANRADVDRPEFWENLVILALLRKHGARVPRPIGFRVCVEIEEVSEEEVL